MKPDWKDAPGWAKWLAMDGCGDWYWYEDKPWFDDGTWYVPKGGLALRASHPVDEKDSLEARP